MTSVLHILPHRGGGGETYVDLLEGLDGFEHERIYLAGGRTPLTAAPTLAAGLLKAVRAARRADLLHAHGDVAAALAAPILSRRPSVWTTHGLHFGRRATGVTARLARATTVAAVNATSSTLCTSGAELEELASVTRPERRERLRLVRNGIRLPPRPTVGERRAARAALGVTGDDVAALFLGELEPRKAPLVAVAAAVEARRRGAPLVLLVAGDGPQTAAVAEHAGPAVRPLGFRRDVAVLLAAAEILVMPSEREGLSFAVLEAMGRGLATVVSDGVGNPEAVGPEGIVLPVGSVSAFAATLERLALDPVERHRRGEQARGRVAVELSAERLLEGVGDAYSAALVPDATVGSA